MELWKSVKSPISSCDDVTKGTNTSLLPKPGYTDHTWGTRGWRRPLRPPPVCPLLNTWTVQTQCQQEAENRRLNLLECKTLF